jgi:hypothetical protein
MPPRAQRANLGGSISDAGWQRWEVAGLPPVFARGSRGQKNRKIERRIERGLVPISAIWDERGTEPEEKNERVLVGMPPRKIVEYLHGDEGVNIDENELLQRIGTFEKGLSRQHCNKAEVGALSLALVRPDVIFDRD